MWNEQLVVVLPGSGEAKGSHDKSLRKSCISCGSLTGKIPEALSPVGNGHKAALTAAAVDDGDEDKLNRRV